MQDAKEICHLDKGQVTCWNSWHSRSVITLIAYAFLAVTAALERAAERGRNDPAGAGLVPLSSHELLRRLQVLTLPPPRRDRDTTCCGGPPGAAAINTALASATAVGTHTPTP